MSEIKYVPLQADIPAQDAVSGFYQNLTPNISQGVDKDERLGNLIQYKFMQFRMWFVCNPGTAQKEWMIFRFIIFQARIPLGAIPANKQNMTVLFDLPNINSSIKNQNARILMDRTIRMGPVGYADSTYSPAIMVFKKKFRINNRVTFRNAAATLPEDPKDTYHLVIIPNDGVNQNQVQIVGNLSVRYSYYDI